MMRVFPLSPVASPRSPPPARCLDACFPATRCPPSATASRRLLPVTCCPPPTIRHRPSPAHRRPPGFLTPSAPRPPAVVYSCSRHQARQYWRYVCCFSRPTVSDHLSLVHAPHCPTSSSPHYCPHSRNAIVLFIFRPFPYSRAAFIFIFIFIPIFIVHSIPSSLPFCRICHLDISRPIHGFLHVC